MRLLGGGTRDCYVLPVVANNTNGGRAFNECDEGLRLGRVEYPAHGAPAKLLVRYAKLTSIVAIEKLRHLSDRDIVKDQSALCPSEFAAAIDRPHGIGRSGRVHRDLLP